MKKYLFIGIGGFLGTICRYSIKRIENGSITGIFPINTFFVNLSGSFLLALFLAYVLECPKISEETRVGIATGFFGAYTTFSTFCKETMTLLEGGDFIPALVYLSLTVFLGLAAAYAGFVLGRKLHSIKGIKHDTSGRNTSNP